jgi:uncharacterized protein YecT (DUF1311 family)
MDPTWSLSRMRSVTLFTLVTCIAAITGQPARGAGSEAAATPALVACETFATAHYRQASPADFGSLRLLEEGSSESRGTRAVGSQAVATVLTGTGVRRDNPTAVINVHFVCLLESSGKPVFFELIENGPRDPAEVCWDAFEPAGWGPLTDCLQQALEREESALTAALAAAREQAGSTMSKAAAARALTDSNARWAAYRDSECDRRQAFVAGRNHPDIGELTCRLRKTAERLADMHFDD